MNRTRSAGFVITLEFLLVMAIFVVPLMIGLTLLARKFYTAYEDRREAVEMPYSKPAVWDSSGNAATCVPANPQPNGCARVVGPVVDYDQFEAPVVIFRDAANMAGVFLGVRRERFTTYGQVFYTGATCTGTPYIRAWDLNVAAPTSNFPTAPFAPLPLLLYPPTGFAYQMQGVSYAMGFGNVLYSSTVASTSGSLGSVLGIGSIWISESVTPTTAGLPIAPCFSGLSLPPLNLLTGLVPATTVINFDGTQVAAGPPAGDGSYTWPFRLSFPTPNAAPALPCPTGEC